MFVVAVSTAVSVLSEAATQFSCEAKCVLVRSDSKMGMVLVREGDQAYGEGESRDQAYEQMMSRCAERLGSWDPASGEQAQVLKSFLKVKSAQAREVKLLRRVVDATPRSSCSP